MSFNISIWKALSLQLKKLKGEEADMRREICEEIIADTEMKNGRVTVKDHMDGYDIKAVQTLSYTLDVAVLGTIWKHLSECEQACVQMVPKLKLAPYKNLPEDSLLHEAIVTRLAMPVLTAEQVGE